MIGFALLAFPFVVLGFVLFMERVEEPLNRIGQTASQHDIEQFLDGANPAELNTLVTEGTEPAVRRFRARLGLGRRRRGRRTAAPATFD